MRVDIKFKSIQYSQSLVDYTCERVSKIEKFEIRPTTIHITFSQEGHNQRAYIYVKGVNSNFRANCSAETFQFALDECLRKMKRQMEKEKSKIKHHHHRDHSHEAQLELLAWQEEQNKKIAA